MIEDESEVDLNFKNLKNLGKVSWSAAVERIFSFSGHI